MRSVLTCGWWSLGGGGGSVAGDRTDDPQGEA